MAVEISRVFVSMRRFILENGDLIKRVAELQSRQIAFENETARKFDAFFLRRRKVVPQVDDFSREKQGKDGKSREKHAGICEEVATRDHRSNLKRTENGAGRADSSA